MSTGGTEQTRTKQDICWGFGGVNERTELMVDKDKGRNCGRGLKTHTRESVDGSFNGAVSGVPQSSS